MPAAAPAVLRRQLEQRSAELRAAQDELELFAHALAHDLRSPLITIEGFSRALEAACGDDVGERGRHYLARIRSGVRQMSSLTDALLALAGVARAELRPGQVDLALLARTALGRLQQAEPQRVVHVQMPEQLLAYGDSRLLAAAVEQLVGNAWKFSAREPQVRIRIGSRPGPGGEVVYYIADQGAGFDMAHAARLFGTFQRLHPIGEFEGAGVGLALVQRIVARHGGRVWAEAHPGDGATFYFTLPIARLR